MTETKELTLQQKMVKLREAIPSIEKKKHSKDVKYKFAKIDDIYEMLTPAMNELGVNFDVISETPSRFIEGGGAEFYHTFEQKTQYGTRLLWIYEADLLLRWTNADDPTDTLDVTLHAIGTNDGGPDKAKGSAWTYCLKYYFFEKFGIDQGEDDPDNAPTYGTPSQNAQNAPQAQGSARATQSKGKAQKAQEGAQSALRVLADADLAFMYAAGEAVGWGKTKLDGAVYRKYGCLPENMNKEQYLELIKGLNDMKQTENKGEENNGEPQPQ